MHTQWEVGKDRQAKEGQAAPLPRGFSSPGRDRRHNLQAVLGRKLDLLEHTRLPVQSGAVSTQRLKHYTEVCSGVCEQKHRVVSLSQGVVAWHLDRVLS